MSIPPNGFLPAVPSLQGFHRRAEQGEPLKVVFLGGSLTWGANASDPQRTSYRGLMMEYFLARYVRTSFSFVDAAIGGTGSDLALHRLDRDVLTHRPDLVFLDCTVNDGAEQADEQRLASYERVLRDLLAKGCAVFPVLLGTKRLVMGPQAKLPCRHQAHLRIAKAYECPVANVLQAMREKVRAGDFDPEKVWCLADDETHPDDAGYGLFAEVIRETYEKAIARSSPANIPGETVFSDRYPFRQRQILVDVSLPAGWRRVKTYRTSLWFDGLSSRWMGDVAGAGLEGGKAPAGLGATFRGSMIGLLGERDGLTPPFRVWIDGEPICQIKGSSSSTLWRIDTAGFAPSMAGTGRLFAWTPLATDLRDGDHVLRVEPDFSGALPEAELRIESICSAGR